MKAKEPAAISSPAASSEIVLYQTEDRRTRVACRFENETVWLTQTHMAELFQTSSPNVSMHVRNVFQEGELTPDSVVKDCLTTAADEKDYQTSEGRSKAEFVSKIGDCLKNIKGTDAARVSI